MFVNASSKIVIYFHGKIHFMVVIFMTYTVGTCHYAIAFITRRENAIANEVEPVAKTNTHLPITFCIN